MNYIETEILTIDKNNPESEKIKKGAKTLIDGGVVAFPTETVYGLGVNALDEKVISKVFEAKGRPQDNPLIVHIAHIDQLRDITEEVPLKAYRLMEKFWPGPLTILFKKSEKVPSKITAGLPTVAVRMPSHNIALELIRQSKLPIAAPSANLSGKPSPTTASHVIEDLKGRIDMIIDGGSTGIGLESTVIDISGRIPTILRPGGITLEELLTVLPKIEYDPALEDLSETLIPKSPGQKYRHYSPKAKMQIVQGKAEDTSREILRLSEMYEEQNMRVGIMATEETKNIYNKENVLVVGSRENPETIASNLFRILREFDILEVDIILAEGIDEKGIGKAIMNRMKKAASGEIICL